MADELLRVETSGEADTAASLIGELDLSSYEQAAASLEGLFRAEGDVRLDLTRLTFVDSSGIRLFIRLQQALDGRGRLVLVSPPAQVARILDIAGLQELGIRVEGAGS